MIDEQSRPLQIFVVEDDPDHQLLIRRAIREVDEGASVTLFSDGDSALETLQNGGAQPDLILLDINMPGRSGFEILEEMRESDTLRDVPTVMLTSSQLGQDIERAYELGARGYISKPNTFQDLKAVLSNTLLYWAAIVRAKWSQGGR